MILEEVSGNQIFYRVNEIFGDIPENSKIVKALKSTYSRYYVEFLPFTV